MADSAAPALYEFRFALRREWREPLEHLIVVAPDSATAVEQLPDCVTWNFAQFEDGTYRRAV